MMVTWSCGRFPTAGWIQCCLHGIIKQGKEFADHVGKGSVPIALFTRNH